MHFPQIPGHAAETPVSFFFEDAAEFEFGDEAALSDWLVGVAVAEKVPFHELSVIFCSDERLREINVEFLQHDYYTDIITFPYSDDAVHGDLFISVERVADNAAQLNVPFRQELCRVLAHGVLHLCGYGDKTPEETVRMREMENKYLALLSPTV
ncbi:MAG: rRNA maturation RNase YbeY [Saprospiraceae bacterium]